jgi:hypothetical protein
MDQEMEAHNLVSQGDRNLNPGCWVRMCSSKDERFDLAKDCYEKAGNMFKLSKKFFEAGECFEKCGRLMEQLNEPCDNYFEEAYYSFQQCDKKSIFNF